MNNIKDKVVIITGASSGIGEATAKELVANGAKIILGARREDRLKKIVKDIESEGGTAIFRVTDVRKKEDAKALVNLAINRYGKVDVLINNAGIMPTSFLVDNNTEEWDNLIDINIKGVLYNIGANLKYMREQNSGQIINISSVAGYESAGAYGTVYSMTKQAVRHISEGLRQQEALANSNIRITDIGPGAIDTDLKYTITDPIMREVAIQQYEDKTKVLTAEEMAKTIKIVIEQPDNIAVNTLVVRPLNT